MPIHYTLYRNYVYGKKKWFCDFFWQKLSFNELSCSSRNSNKSSSSALLSVIFGKLISNTTWHSWRAYMLCSYYICRQKKNWKMCQNSGCCRQDYSGKKSEIVSNILFLDFVSAHSSQIIGLCLMKCSSETLQNLPYSWNTKLIYFFMIHCTIFFITRTLCSLYYLLFAQSNITYIFTFTT